MRSFAVHGSPLWADTDPARFTRTIVIKSAIIEYDVFILI